MNADGLVDHAERVARAALSALVEPGHTVLMRRVDAAGAEATLRAIRRGDTKLDPNHRMRDRLRSGQVDGEEVLATADRLGIGYLCPGEAGWPVALEAMRETLDAGADAVPPPLGLWWRGEAELATAAESAVAVVGSRNATRYGERVAADLGSDLAMAGWTVVSGAAFGIDAASHRGALAMGGTTVAVLACGVDVAYPKSHASLLDRIAAQGVVLSEMPPGVRPMRSWFLARNRIIAALSAGSVVVEAAMRSGALSTAGWAVKLSREVLAVPGPVTSALSAGCHDLVREKGATLVTDARDVVDAVGALGADAVPARRGEDRPFDRLSPVHRRLREAMAVGRTTSVAMLVEATSLSAATVRAEMDVLAGAGWVEEDGAGWRLPRGGP